MNFRKIRALPFLLALLGLLLCGCVTKPQPRTDDSGSAATGDTDTAPDTGLADLQRQLEELRTALRLQNESYEARLRELERALSSGVPTGGGESTDFTYETTDAGVVLTGWNGTGRTLTIPQTLGGKTVVAIADGAFRDRDLETVVIGDGVCSIGWFAFSGCYRLTSVTVPASVSVIGYGAFEYCASGLRIICPSGSYAAQYAASYGIPTSGQ